MLSNQRVDLRELVGAAAVLHASEDGAQVGTEVVAVHRDGLGELGHFFQGDFLRA